jgi:hypothetical protein
MNSPFKVGEDAIKAFVTDSAVIDAFYRDRNFETGAEELRQARMRSMQAIEDASPLKGYGLARMLEYIVPKVLEEQYEPLNAMRLFTVDSSIPEGPTTFTVRRRKQYGEWRYGGGNESAPTGSLSLEEKSFKINPAIHAVRLNIHAQRSAQYMGLNLESELRRVAQETSQEFLNGRAWQNAMTGMSDVLNYPFIPRITAAAAFNDSTASADTILSELHGAANFCAARSKGRFGPTRMILDRRLHDYLATRYRSNLVSESILEAFLAKNPYIKSVEIADELDGISPLISGGGVPGSVILFDRPGEIKHVLPKGVTALPAQRDGYDIVIPMYLLHGGIRIDEPLNCAQLHVLTPANA